MDLSIKNRLLVFANDAAGANMTAAFAYLYKDNYSEILAFSNGAALKIYKEYIPQFITEKEITFDFNDTVVTGTSGLESKYEMNIVKNARKAGVNKTITIVDNVANFDMRFTLDKEILKEQFSPNEIWVFEKRFKSGIKYLDKKIVYKENIYYQFLKKLFKTNPPKITHPFVHKYSNNYILILTEYIYELYGTSYGFTEYDMLENILKTISETSLDIPIFIKLHPREYKNKFNIILRKYDNLNMIKDECNIQELVYYSKIILGINSSVFMDAKLFGKEVYSVQINSFENMPIDSLSKENIIYKNSELKNIIFSIKSGL